MGLLRGVGFFRTVALSARRGNPGARDWRGCAGGKGLALRADLARVTGYSQAIPEVYPQEIPHRT